MGASVGAFASELRFDDGSEPDISELMVVAALGRRVGSDLSIRVAMGAILGGSLGLDGVDHEVGTGFLVSVSLAYRWSFARNTFVTLGGSASVSTTTTRAMGVGESTRLTAGDLRISAIGGVTLWDRVSPYVLVRGFGGPVRWRIADQDTTGTDQHHYQVGLGLSASLPAGFSALIDASLLGERSISVGASYAF